MKDRAHNLFTQLNQLLDELQSAEADPQLTEKKKQLQAIEKTIQQMQKAGISIPDEMRHLKSKFINDLSETEHAEATLQYVNQEVIKLTKRLGFSVSTVNANNGHTKRDRRPKTDNVITTAQILLKKTGW